MLRSGKREWALSGACWERADPASCVIGLQRNIHSLQARSNIAAPRQGTSDSIRCMYQQAYQGVNHMYQQAYQGATPIRSQSVSGNAAADFFLPVLGHSFS